MFQPKKSTARFALDMNLHMYTIRMEDFMNQSDFPTPEFFDVEKVSTVWRIPYEQRAKDARDFSLRTEAAYIVNTGFSGSINLPDGISVEGRGFSQSRLFYGHDTPVPLDYSIVLNLLTCQYP